MNEPCRSDRHLDRVVTFRSVKEILNNSGSNSLSLRERASFDFALLRSGRTGIIVQGLLN